MNEPVGTYIPELAGLRVAVDDSGSETEPARRQPTIQDLMLHTAGFPGLGETALHERAPQPIVNQRISRQEFLSERLFEPLGMNDTVFTLSPEQAGRQAQVLPVDPITGAPQETRNMRDPWPFDCGSGCLASTAMDYLAFAQMLLNGGELNGERVLARKTVEYMISDHIGPDIDMSRLYLTTSVPAYGYGHGLGGVVRRASGPGNRPGSPGEYYWVGSQGTGFFVDPIEELAVVYMAQTPGEIRGSYRELIPTLIYQALID